MILTFIRLWLENWPAREAWAFARKMHREKRGRWL